MSWFFVLQQKISCLEDSHFWAPDDGNDEGTTALSYNNAIAVQTTATIIVYLVHKYDIYLTSGLDADSWIVSAVLESSLPIISRAAVSSPYSG